MKQSKVLFRADGSTEIGYGHFIRSMSIAQMISSGYEVHFATYKPDDFIKSELDKSNIHSILINENDTIGFVELCANYSITVLDNYYFDVGIQREIKNTGSKLICIDDHQHTMYDTDVILNHAPGLRSEFFAKSNYSKLALGPNYAMLRPQFFKEVNHKKVERSVIICFGGADKLLLAQRIGEELGKNFKDFQFHVVCPNVKQNEQSLENVFFYSNLSANELCLLMDTCNYAVVPSSTVLFEVLARGLNVMSGYYVDNQRLIYAGFKSEGYILPYGDFANFTELNYQFKILTETDPKEFKKLELSLVKANYQKLFDELSKA